MNSLDLDNDNPESEPDLDSPSFGSFNPTLGVESSSRSLDQHEANLSLGTLGHKTMAIGFSLGSLIQQQQDDQEGMQIGTAWEPSLMHKKPKKTVSFDEASLAHNKRQQNNRQQAKGSHPTNFQLEQLGSNTEKQELPDNNNKRTTAASCWNSFQQETEKQQQTASALAKELQHKACPNNSLGREGQTLGSLESVTHIQQACRSPKHNNNTSNLGIGTKNTAAWGILIDTGAAISLAPLSFAQNTELSPLEGTLQLRSVTGNIIETYGRRTVQLVGSNLCLLVSFVIANVEQALIGMDILLANQLSLVRNSFNEYYLVNAAGATTQLQPRGHLLYMEACPTEFGFSNCRGSSLPETNGSLLDDKGRTQEEAGTLSGGACDTSFSLENLRQQQAKNTANLGTTTALPAKGAKRRKKKKPSAKTASQDQLDQRSLEQKGQISAAASPRSLEKTRIIKEMELAAEGESRDSLGSIDLQELSLRILLTLSLHKKWLITTTRATGDCSEEALGNQLRTLGLGENKVDKNIFSGDELVILIHKQEILIGGTDQQQELLFCELSALIPLDPPTRLDQATQVSFGNMTLEYKAASHSVSLSVPTSFVEELFQRHDLPDEDSTTSLDKEELNDQEASEHIALEADQQELYRQTVGDLVWLAAACRHDLSYEVHLLTHSLTTPTTGQQKQLHRVLRYLAETRHYSLSLHPTTKSTKEKPQSLELVAFSSTSWTEAWKATSTAYLQLWGASLIASCKTSCAQQQEHAELESMRLALGLACHIRKPSATA